MDGQQTRVLRPLGQEAVWTAGKGALGAAGSRATAPTAPAPSVAAAVGPEAPDHAGVSPGHTR